MPERSGYERSAHLYDLFDAKPNVAFFGRYAREDGKWQSLALLGLDLVAATCFNQSRVRSPERALRAVKGRSEMKKVHGASLANTFIWGAAIIAAAIILRGTPQGGQVVVILGGAAGASMIIVSNALHQP